MISSNVTSLMRSMERLAPLELDFMRIGWRDELEYVHRAKVRLDGDLVVLHLLARGYKWIAKAQRVVAELVGQRAADVYDRSVESVTFEGQRVPAAIFTLVRPGVVSQIPVDSWKPAEVARWNRLAEEYASSDEVDSLNFDLVSLRFVEPDRALAH